MINRPRTGFPKSSFLAMYRSGPVAEHPDDDRIDVALWFMMTIAGPRTGRCSMPRGRHAVDSAEQGHGDPAAERVETAVAAAAQGEAPRSHAASEPL